MKKQFLSIIIAMAAVTFIGCSSEEASNNDATESTEETTEATAQYACPMDCENGKVYDQAGDCPVCGMALTENGE